MSQPDEKHPLTSSLQEEVIGGLPELLARILNQLTPLARLRLFAFLHLVDAPETLKASLEIKPTGHLRLILDTFAAPCRSRQH